MKCPGCGRRNRSNARRCSQCGNRLAYATPVHVSKPDKPSPGPLLGAPPEQLDKIDEIQRELLMAAMDSSAPTHEIVVYREPGSVEGEVRAGATRIHGDKAVLAAVSLLAPGLVVITAEDRFRLSSEGRRLARYLLDQS